MLAVISRDSLSELISNGMTLSDAYRNGLEDIDNLALTVSNGVDVFCHRFDKVDSRRMVLAVPETPDELARRINGHEPEILERLLAFLDSMDSKKVLLPETWNAVKSGNFISFFLASRDRLYGAPRWNAEIRSNATAYLWTISDNTMPTDLQKLKPAADVPAKTDAAWHNVISDLKSHFTAPASNGLRVDVELPPSNFGDVTQDLSFSKWIDKITPKQRLFVTQQSRHSIKLRGPAGSGKTLTLILKAMHSLHEAHSRGEDIRILFVTHTWALAGEISAIISRLSEWGEAELITVVPLVAVAEDFLPGDLRERDLELVGDDSLSGKLGQLSIIENIIDRLRRGNWLRFRDHTSAQLRQRIEADDPGERRALAWDCLIEFGCVFGADGIFPDVVDAEARYMRLARAPWMMPLDGEYDKKVILDLYASFTETLEQQGKLSSDQLVNDLLNYFEMTVWNRRRKLLGYDEIYVDEFHLFNAQERQLLRYMTRSGAELPRIYMALDPRQSPWEAYVASTDATPTSGVRHDDGLGVTRAVDLTAVHRFSPEILEFVKRLHLEFPNLDLGDDWHLSFSEIESTAESGAIPSIIRSASIDDEATDIYNRLRKLGPNAQVAVAIVDQDLFERYKHVVSGLVSNDIKVKVLTGRDDFNPLQSRKRGIIFAPAEYLAGLQFETVIIAGIPDLAFGVANQSYRRRRHLSLLYLAATRASRSLMLFINDDLGGFPSLFKGAADEGLVKVER